MNIVTSDKIILYERNVSFICINIYDFIWYQSDTEWGLLGGNINVVKHSYLSGDINS